MNRNMRDHMMPYGTHDERNPYGSRGGYVTSGRDRDMDGRMRGGRRYDREMDDYGYYGRDPEYDERSYRGSMRRDRSMMFEGEYRGDFRMHDYGSGYLSHKELRHWQDKLCKEMNQQECDTFRYDNVIHCAKEMNISFDKYSEEEFYTTVLMMFTDYKESCGENIHMYVAMAKEFLEDRDAGIKYGEKLAVYHDAIACV